MHARARVNTDSRPLLLASVAPRFRRYRVLRTLETLGSSEAVLAAVEGAFGFERTVVIKRLLPGVSIDPAMLNALSQAATAYGALTHPAIVRMVDFFTADGRPAMVLEHIDGWSLRRVLAVPRHTLPICAVLHIGARLFAALSAAHNACDPWTGARDPIVHQHVSPAAVLITRAGDVKLSDFGFARLADGLHDEAGTLEGDLNRTARLLVDLLAGRTAGLPDEVRAVLDRALTQGAPTLDAQQIHPILRSAADHEAGQRALAESLVRVDDEA